MNDLTIKVAEMLKTAKIPDGRHFVTPQWRTADYRGKRQKTVGYSWSRLGSHYASGRVYDVVLGAGETFEEALASAYKKQK